MMAWGERKWSKEAVVGALRARVANKEELAHSKVPNDLREAARQYFGGYAQAIAAAGLDYGSIRRRPAWDKGTIVSELRALHAAGVKPSSTATKRKSLALYRAAVRHFGSFAGAMRAAGIEYKAPREWGALEIFDELRRLLRKGEDLGVGKMQRHHGGLLVAAKRVFGSYEQAIATLGVDYKQICKLETWDKEKIVGGIRELARSGIKMNYAEMHRRAGRLVQATRKHFGSLAKAMKAAGIEYERRRRWTRRRIVERLLELHRQGEDLSANSMHRKHGALLSTTWRIFGSYRKAVEKAGLDYTEIARFAHWDKKTVLRKMRALSQDGVDMGYTALQASHPRLLQAAVTAFGTYPAARVAAGVGPAPLTRWNQKKIIAELRKLRREGVNLATSRLTQTHPALLDAAAHHFGTFAKAVEAAGFNYEQIRLKRTWSDEEIIAELRALDQRDQDMRGSVMQKNHGGLYRVAYMHFGSYQNALERAGLDYPPRKPLAGWSRSG
ncbi:MAG TPA: hypothetical protein VGQ99_04965, partial [Tepidisphaeraceae bacterium]|nr:hypothetical protein [Tepidisphaeraceae bacterium]